MARQDGSGTTYAMTHHLSAVSDGMAQRPRNGTTINWPGVTMTARGNEGVARPDQAQLGILWLRRIRLRQAAGLADDPSGKQGRPIYVAPALAGAQAALAANIGKIPPNLRVFLPDPGRRGGYPIMTLSWLLLHGQYADQGKRDAS